MLDDLFDWEAWDRGAESLDMTFYNVTLKKGIGSLKQGDKFDQAYINYDDGDLRFSSEGIDDVEFGLELKIRGYKKYL